MDDGDVVVLLAEHQLVTEVAGLADAWDEVLCRNLAHVIQQLEVSEVQLAVARRDECLELHDARMVRDLTAELADTGIAVHPLIALPAAA
jgi:hypothetical protein